MLNRRVMIVALIVAATATCVAEAATILPTSRQELTAPSASYPTPSAMSWSRVLAAYRMLGFGLTQFPIFSDPGQIEQVILNLAINARDAMPGGGRILLETTSVVLPPANDQGLPAGPYVALTVSDTGTGIPGDVLPHIFEPFFTTKPVGQGTGLGLSISSNLVREHGGRLEVQSEQGVGTTFTIVVPVGESGAAT